MNPVSGLLRRTPPVPLPEPASLANLPVRKIATTGITAAATLVAMSAASAATSALRRRVEHR